MKNQIYITNRYQVIKKIGEGGMAKVYLSYDQKNEMNVAIKVLKKENVIDKKIKNFKREAQLLGLMDDENIVKIHDVGEHGSIHYIVTEYVDGMTMKDYIATCSPVPVEEVVDLTMQVLLGLQHAHDKGVIHKDIKSQNILLNEDKQVKITDFGIASIIETEHTKTQSLMGTPQYVAPEILNREELTLQSDIYSVGIMMFELLTGKAPFTGESPGIIMMKQISQPIPSVISERGDVPQSLENVVIKATAKSLDNRYTNVKEMMEDLESVLTPERKFEEKTILYKDTINEDNNDKTVALNPELDINTLAKEGELVKKNGNRKKYVIGFAALIIAILMFLILTLSKPPLEMPDVVGKSEEDAVSEVSISGFGPDNIEIIREANEDVEAGYVISSNPTPGTIINEDSVAILKISTGLEKNIMENYETKLISNVEGQLEKKGYNVEVIEQDNSLPAGTIISQDPEVGASITTDDIMTFYVSTGNFSVEIPNFTGLELDSAEAWSSDYSIRVNTAYSCNDTFGEGLIYSQDPDLGSTINNGGEILVNISDGACASSEETEEDTTTSEEATTDTSDDNTSAN